MDPSRTAYFQINYKQGQVYGNSNAEHRTACWGPSWSPLNANQEWRLSHGVIPVFPLSKWIPIYDSLWQPESYYYVARSFAAPQGQFEIVLTSGLSLPETTEHYLYLTFVFSNEELYKHRAVALSDGINGLMSNSPFTSHGTLLAPKLYDSVLFHTDFTVPYRLLRFDLMLSSGMCVDIYPLALKDSC